jgi:hypothetical protein
MYPSISVLSGNAPVSRSTSDEENRAMQLRQRECKMCKVMVQNMIDEK